MNTTDQSRPPLITWWVLWAAFQIGIFIMYYFLGRPPQPELLPPIPTPDSPTWIVALVPVGISSVIRWLLIPRTTSAQLGLQMFVIGIAMAEAPCFFGIFIFPLHKLELLIASALGIFQFIPYFASRYAADSK